MQNPTYDFLNFSNESESKRIRRIQLDDNFSSNVSNFNPYVSLKKDRNKNENLCYYENGEDRYHKLCQKDTEIMNENFEQAVEVALNGMKRGNRNKQIPHHTNAMSYIKELTKSPLTPDSFHVIDIGKVAERFHYWKNNLSEVVPFYAVKANPDECIIEALAALGVGFDCASEKEMIQVMNYGVSSDRIIFSNPRKFTSGIHFAKSHKIKKMTFDSMDELEKMLEIYPEGEYVMRIKTDDSHSIVKLSSKFGCSISIGRELIKLCYENNANLIGLSFHVGSNCSNTKSYEQAISNCAVLFKEAKEKFGINFKFLDIGGGWPGTNDTLFEEMTKLVKQNLIEHFDSKIFIIAEPGRFFSAPVVSLVTKIIGIDNFSIEQPDDSEKQDPEKYFAYFLSDGIYQSFLDSLYYQYDLNLIKSEGLDLKPLSIRAEFDAYIHHPSILYGPTCDCGDKVIDRIMLPIMKRGDYLYSHNSGAYFNAMATNFNGIKKSKAYYFYTDINDQK